MVSGRDYISDFDAIAVGPGLGGLTAAALSDRAGHRVLLLERNNGIDIPAAGSAKGVHTAVPGLWLASTFGGLGGFTGAMLAGMLAARAATKAIGPAGA